MKKKLKPIGEQVAVVVGASSGIGRVTALELGKRGARAVVAFGRIDTWVHAAAMGGSTEGAGVAAIESGFGREVTGQSA